MDDFIIRALLGGTILAIVYGPLGCLVVWKRMAYFGATLSHSAILGVVMGLLMDLNLYLCMILICLLMALLLWMMQKNTSLSSDTTLGILAHSSLALGIIGISLVPGFRVDLMSYLFGDILTITKTDIIYSFGIVMVVFLVLSRIWSNLISLISQRDLALVDGVNESQNHLIFLLLLSTTIALSIQIIGVLLIVSMLIIPAATARPFSDSPEKMAGFAISIGIFAILGGIGLSLYYNTPAGPSIVAISSLIFILGQLVSKIFDKE